jgi:osmotically-inducible protein OsmY
MPSEELRRSVSDELLWDPKVDNLAIAVEAHDGVVTLRGSVGSFREKREATTAAQRVDGVKRVDNELQVKIMSERRRDDADLRGAVLQALVLDSGVPSTVDAKVLDGVVTLTGSAEWRHQRDEAERVAGNVMGVRGLVNEIVLSTSQPYAGDVQNSIRKAFERRARLDAESLRVDAADGTVTLSGIVGSLAEHDAAIEAAWAAPGVTSVDDQIVVGG